MVLVFFHHWWRQFPWILLRRNKLHEHSFDDIQFDWLQINLIDFHWIFSNRNDTHGILINETDFWGNHIHELFPRISLWQKLVSWNSIQSKLFFLSFQFEIEFPPISSWWSWFLQLSHGRNQFPWFFCARSSLLWLSPEWKKVSWIFRNEINFYKFPSTYFMLHGVTNAGMFFP